MVRLDKCVEALYDNGMMDDKTKTMQILHVMKGAISMSKSKTGECIFRHNKTEKKNLALTIQREKRNNVYNVARIDTGKKLVVSRWTKILEKRTACNSQTMFEELLDINEPGCQDDDRRLGPRESTFCDDTKLKKFLDLRITKSSTSSLGLGWLPRSNTVTALPTKDGAPESNEEMFVTERKAIRDKYAMEPKLASNKLAPITDPKLQGTVLAKSSPLRLPGLSTNARFKRPSLVEEAGFKRPSLVEEPAGESQQPIFERDLTNWEDWRLKDKDWILEYIQRQKTRQVDLIMRNALGKIEDEMSGANMIKRQQVRQKIMNEREADDRKHVAGTKLERESSRIHRQPSIVREKSVTFADKRKIIANEIQPGLFKSKLNADANSKESSRRPESAVPETAPRKQCIRREKTNALMFTRPRPRSLPVILENSAPMKTIMNVDVG